MRRVAQRRLVLADGFDVLLRGDVLITDELGEVRRLSEHHLEEVRRIHRRGQGGAEPPCASGLRFCSTVNLTSSAVISPKPSWNCTPERSLNVHVLSSFDGFHSVARPGRYSNVLGSRMISGSYAQSHRVFSDWLDRQAN